MPQSNIPVKILRENLKFPDIKKPQLFANWNSVECQETLDPLAVQSFVNLHFERK